MTREAATGGNTTTYSAWDNSGRPIAARDVGAGFDNTRAIAYDNGARTRTTVVNSGVVTTVETFDADGNIIRNSSSGVGSSLITTMSANVTSTGRLCK